MTGASETDRLRGALGEAIDFIAHRETCSGYDERGSIDPGTGEPGQPYPCERCWRVDEFLDYLRHVGRIETLSAATGPGVSPSDSDEIPF